MSPNETDVDLQAMSCDELAAHLDELRPMRERLTARINEAEAIYQAKHAERSLAEKQARLYGSLTPAELEILNRKS